ncbi:MAG: glutamine synthetase family protein [Chloroflexota bacterium]|nr:glutamine synthetase family protein [Chloroflexota bacterium]
MAATGTTIMSNDANNLAQSNSTTTPASVLNRAQEANVEFVDLQFIDILGMVKSVTIAVEQLPIVIARGMWFDGSSVEGTTRVAERDMYLIPDLATFAIVPWAVEGGVTARLLCGVHRPDGEPFPGDPRAVLTRQLDRARACGYTYAVAPEIEYFLLRRDGERIRPPEGDSGGYFDSAGGAAAAVQRDVVRLIREMGIHTEAYHHEVSVGQYEIDFPTDGALRTADGLITFRTAMKAVAARRNLHATFMPKPIAGLNGSGMHIHQRLDSLDSGLSVFTDASDSYGLSETARAFMAGQLAHARGMSAVLSPLVNSYRRFVPGHEAPVFLIWARVNHEALIRVPADTGPQHAGQIELRCPDPAANPYLAFAVMLAAGLDGIERNLSLPEPFEESLYSVSDEELRSRNVGTLPMTLGEAITELELNPVIREALGDHIYERYVAALRQQWHDYRTCISQWEIDRYLEAY